MGRRRDFGRAVARARTHVRLGEERGFDGSAFGLVRSLIAAFFKVQWAVACADEAQVEKIANKRELEFFGAEDMVKEIDEKLKTNGFFLCFKKNAWKAMNSYTHTCLLQLSRPFSGNRVEPRYRETECIEVINVITSAVILLGGFINLRTERPAAAEQAEKLMYEFADS
jgi:hypothetical protein